MDWFYTAQPRDPPRVPPVQQYDTFVEPDVHQQPVAAATPDEADVDVHHLGHAVLIFFFLVFCVSCFLFFSILLLTIIMFVFLSLARMLLRQLLISWEL